MYFAEMNVDEPLEKLLGDWDLLDDRVIKKISTFKEFGDNVVGIRRRVMQNGQILDPLKGYLPQSVEIQMVNDRSLSIRLKIADCQSAVAVRAIMSAV